MSIISVTRRFEFSAAHRYWRDDWSPKENARAFGERANSFGHGHNYTLDVTVRGVVDPLTGMVINVSAIKGIVNDVLAQFDHKHLNLDTPFFQTMMPTTENIVRVLWQLLAPRIPAGASLARLRLYELQDLWAEYDGAQEGSFARAYTFSAAHRLHAAGLSGAENQALYGACNNPNGHGHNYTLEVTVRGPVDPDTGMVIDLAEMDSMVHTVIERLDHRHLDREVPAFAQRPSTGEHIVDHLWGELAPRFEGRLAHLRLWETKKNMFEREA
jgi:6-pyruvoyltetrahydropterin/6-carboxytetrahydropterin synthase